MNPACWTCEEPMEDLGYADALTSRDRVELVRTYRCRFCLQEYIRDEKPPADWRDEIRAATRRVLASPNRGVTS